jgi:proline iminopeptidase
MMRMLAWAVVLAGMAPMAGAGTLVRGGATIAYEVAGTGTPVLLLAGGPGIDAAYLAPLAKSLATAHRTVVLHQRGTGRSEVKPLDASTVSLRLLLEDIEALRVELGIDRWVILGHSWGGLLGMAYAQAHPARVRGLVLVGSGGPSMEWMAYYGDNVLARLPLYDRKAAAYWIEPGRYLADPERAVLEYSRATAPAMVYDPEKVLTLVEQSFRPGAFNAAVNLLLTPQIVGYDFRPALARLEAPVLVVQGRQDPVGESTARALADAFPRATLRFLERCGHWPFVEKEEEFLALVREFLAGV